MAFTIREVCPKDFYWFNLLENDYPDASHQLTQLLILCILTDQSEDDNLLHLVPMSTLHPLMDWIQKELLQEKLMKLEQWFELAFHLCKQRWDDSVDWLELQPMSKILLMSRVQSKFVEDQNREMKKAGRKK